MKTVDQYKSDLDELIVGLTSRMAKEGSTEAARLNEVLSMLVRAQIRMEEL